MAENNYPLVKTQIRLLKLLFKFRFATTKLLAEEVGIKPTSMNQNLAVLIGHGLVDRHYKPTDKLERRPARYFITSKGIKQLKSHTPLNDAVVRSYYKNRTVSDTFIYHCLHVFDAALRLAQSYPGRFTILTKADIANYDFFPDIKPDLFLQNDTKEGSFMMYLYEDSPLWAIQKHLRKVIAHEDSEEWPGQYPNVLIACPSASVEFKLLKNLSGHAEEFDIYVTTVKALMNSDPIRVWSEPGNPDERVKL